jgi:hypothetical protein
MMQIALLMVLASRERDEDIFEAFACAHVKSLSKGTKAK